MEKRVEIGMRCEEESEEDPIDNATLKEIFIEVATPSSSSFK